MTSIITGGQDTRGLLSFGKDQVSNFYSIFINAQSQIRFEHFNICFIFIENDQDRNCEILVFGTKMKHQLIHYQMHHQIPEFHQCCMFVFRLTCRIEQGYVDMMITRNEDVYTAKTKYSLLPVAYESLQTKVGHLYPPVLPWDKALPIKDTTFLVLAYLPSYSWYNFLAGWLTIMQACNFSGFVLISGIFKCPFAAKCSWMKRSSLYCVQTSSFLFVGMWRVCKSSKIKHPGGSGGFVI